MCKGSVTYSKISGKNLAFCALLFLLGCNQRELPPMSSSSAEHPAATSSASGETAVQQSGRRSFGSITMLIPAGWAERTPSSQMRKAQFALGKVPGDEDDAELAVFYFGAGQGGSVEANIDRWIGQLAQPDGSASKEKAKISKKEVARLPVTLVDVTGTYSPGMMSPGPPHPGYRLLGAVVETSEGPWFFKMTGPEKTVGKWAGSFDDFLNSIKKGG